MEERVVRLESYYTTEDAVALQCRTIAGGLVEVTVQPWSESVVRIRISRHGAGFEPGIELCQSPQRLLPFVDEGERHLRITCGKLALTIQKEPFGVQLTGPDGARLLCSQHNDLDVRELPKVYPLLLQHEDGVSRIVQAFEIADDEHFYGFGEKFTRLDKRGQSLDLWNWDAYGVGTERSYLNVPFWFSSNGYGVFVNTARRVTCHVGAPPVSLDSFVLEVDGDAVDQFVIWGPEPATILAHYTALTGRPPVPPKWSFGIWASRAPYLTQQEVQSVVAELRRRQIPVDVINLDGMAWLPFKHRCDFTWDTERWPDPKALVRFLDDHHVRMCLWEYPYVAVGTEMFREGDAKGYFLKTPSGATYILNWPIGFPPSAIVDFTNEQAVRWYQSKHQALVDAGARAFKTDFGEQVPEDAVASNGLSGRWLHNIYSVLYQKAVYDVVSKAPGGGVNWSRSGWAGCQRYPIHWGGDPQSTWAGMADSLRGGLSAGLSGIAFWSHDIGGFYGPQPDARLYIRWAQFGLLSSHARFHGRGLREPWAYGEEAERIFREFARIRYSLLPYLFSCAHVARDTGLPVMRALVLEFPDDPPSRIEETEYLLGPYLLVCPVLTPQDERWVYLPPGTWHDWWTGEVLRGSSWQRLNVPLDRIPLYVRQGAILPRVSPTEYVPQGRWRDLAIEVYPSGDGYFIVHDEGESIEVATRREGGHYTVSLSGLPYPVVVRVKAIGRPSTILLDERALPELSGRPERQGEVSEGSEGWWVDGGDVLVRMQAETRHRALRISVRRG